MAGLEMKAVEEIYDLDFGKWQDKIGKFSNRLGRMFTNKATVLEASLRDRDRDTYWEKVREVLV